MPVLALAVALSSLSVHGVAHADDLFVSPSGSDANDGLSVSTPWATLAHATQQLAPGDVLYLLDGTYAESLQVDVNGTAAAPIVIRAQNDGLATVDGEGARVPLRIRGTVDAPRDAHVLVEGIVFRNSSASVIEISRASHVTLRRVSAYDAGPVGNNTVILVAYGSRDVLIEDCAAAGTGRKMLTSFSDSVVTFRRCWARWERHDSASGYYGTLDVYGADDNLIENCVMTSAPDTKNVFGITIVTVEHPSADRNRVIGNVVYGVSHASFTLSSSRYAAEDGPIHHIEGNTHSHNVSIGGRFGMNQRADGTWVGRNFTFVGSEITQRLVRANVAVAPGYTFEPEFVLNGDLRNSSLLGAEFGIEVANQSLIGAWTQDYNNVYDVGTPHLGQSVAGPAESHVDPGYDTARYGSGAYLMIPEALRGKGESGDDIGAEVLYRYDNGELTDEPLWPWPMEERIFAETGISVTWEAHGGLWKTLDDVYPSMPWGVDPRPSEPDAGPDDDPPDGGDGDDAEPRGADMMSGGACCSIVGAPSSESPALPWLSALLFMLCAGMRSSGRWQARSGTSRGARS